MYTGTRLARRGKGCRPAYELGYESYDPLVCGPVATVRWNPTRTAEPHRLPPIREGRTVGMWGFGDPELSPPAPESRSPPLSLRGKRERRISWESSSGGSSSDLRAPSHPLSAPRPRRKNRRKGEIIQPPERPEPPERAEPPTQPPERAEPPTQPPERAEPPTQPPERAEPPTQPPERAEPPTQPPERAEPPTQPPERAEPPTQPPERPEPSTRPPERPEPSTKPPERTEAYTQTSAQLQPCAQSAQPQPCAQSAPLQPCAQPAQPQPCAQPAQPQPWAQSAQPQPWAQPAPPQPDFAIFGHEHPGTLPKSTQTLTPLSHPRPPPMNFCVPPPPLPFRLVPCLVFPFEGV
ncbi:uncharacterized protein [Misgurnus anguillicaudatus]|uniref:uncharacterized protein n=1 Tax=Misgurnus anguillicaudatus TaxID=75329 RepID=UPI003CCF2A5B